MYTMSKKKIIIQILKLINTTWQCLPYDNRKSRIWVSWQIYFTYTYQLIHFHQSKIVHDSPKENNRKKTEISNYGWMCKWTLTDHTVENYYTLRRDEILINTIIWMNCENIHVSNRIFTPEWCAVVTHRNFAHMKLTYSRKKHQKNDGLWELGTEIYWIGIWQFSGWYPLFWSGFGLTS